VRITSSIKKSFILVLIASTLVGMLLTITPNPATASSPPRNIHLTWKHNDTAHTIVVTWQTNDNGAGDNVLYDTTSRGGNKELYLNLATGSYHTYPNAGGYVHDVELTGLSPDTTYYFICGGENGGYSSERSFHTAPVVSKTFTFVVGGDSRSESSDWPASRNDISRAMAKHNPSFVLHVGDYVRNGETDQNEWDNWLTDVQLDWIDNNGLSIPIMPAIGNHEGNGTIYYGQFALPENEKWYSLDWGPDLHITVLSTQDSISGNQLTWLQQDLAAHESTPWKIVIFHEPPYTSGSGHSPRTDIQQTWDPIFDNYHVNLVVCGHVHNYERTFPIYDNKVVKSPFEGTVYFVSGGWGAPLHGAGSGWWTAYTQSTYNFMTVEVVENKAIHLKAYDRNGNLIDSYDIIFVVNLLEPENGATMIENTPTFKWENYFVADNYEIGVADNPSFISPTIKENTTDNTFTPSFPLALGDYWWKIRAYVGGENQPFSTTWTFNIYISTGYWWNTNWTKRRMITVGPHPENFQIKIVIPSEIPQSDYPSIRFLENVASGPLPYWIENCDNGSDTLVYENVVWVRRLENNDNTIYMYYHNPSATSAENGDNVFMFFDDFGGGSGGQGALNTNKWGSSAHGVDVYQTALRLEDYQDETDYIEHTPSKGMNTTEENTRRIVEFRIKNSSTWRGGVNLDGYGWGNNEMWGLYSNSGNKLFGDSGVYGTVNLEGDKWYIGRITFYGENKNRIARSILYGADNANYRQQADNISDWTDGTWNPGGPNWYFDTYRPRVWDGGGNSSYYFDWFIVRKWASPEPGATVGPEEAIPGKPLLYSPPNGTVTTENTPTFQWTIGANADNHRLLVDNDPDFLSSEENVLLGGSDNSYTPSTSLEPENYSWKVVAINTFGQNESYVWTFVVISLPGKPVLYSPPDGITTNDTTQTFEWTIGENADNHRLLVDNDSNFSSPEENVLLGGTDNTHTVTTPLPDDNYSWKVIAINTYGETESSVWTFVVASPPWTGTAAFKLENLYMVGLEKDLQLNTGSRLVVKFYKYDNTFQANSVIENITPPQSVVENENAPHPRAAEGFSWGTVQITRLVLTTDDTENMISTITSFTVHQSHLRSRYMAILAAWGGQPEQQSAFRAEVMDILTQWASAPP